MSELDDLLGVNDEDGEWQCNRCGETYPAQAGEYQRTVCNKCLREIDEENQSEDKE